MTEEEAKTKWCPFARTALINHPDDFQLPPANRLHDYGTGELGIKGALCIGSACMAWRWYDHIGHCGLAGKP